MSAKENKLYLNRNILCIDNSNLGEITYLKKNFCGKVLTDAKELNQLILYTF